MRARGSGSPETREEDEEYSKGKKTGVMKYVGEVEVHTHLQLCTHTIGNVHTRTIDSRSLCVSLVVRVVRAACVR
jgi:hypothetical protein